MYIVPEISNNNDLQMFCNNYIIHLTHTILNNVYFSQHLL